MKIETTTTDAQLRELLAPYAKGDTSPEQEAWIKAKIDDALAKKAAGKMAYHSLDDVMREFGFDAR
jgi:hypothetical protein